MIKSVVFFSNNFSNKLTFKKILTCQKTLFTATAIFLVSFNVIAQQKHIETSTVSIFDERAESVNQAVANPFALSQHRLNYILPFTYVSSPNTLSASGLNTENVDHMEAKYQISVKLPIYQEYLSSSGLYMGFTAVSYWQVYNSEASKPFRETNYEPELFYAWRNQLSFAGFKFNQIRLGLSHQSNGQSGLRSRSWNRVFASAMFSDDDSFYHIKAWYRIKEDKKNNPFDSNGDDNPDITTFMGHTEFGYGTKLGKVNIMALVRNNLKTSENKGSVELNLSYPINTRYDFLLQYFNGYGDSLVDYNRHQERVGVGIQLKFI
ncbi:phospholipase A [Colwellia sp. M166]|uniref:phospholipase A n=1 Tax=Colwellia sp. M166 TaxID=2583805 RepID=UPI00211E9C75|nr:phospholipase A [Colwellia sp. M166]UUO23711.1 phospholipase A [Colwellia sp. M166]|tara:strand:+ start:20147 stop:21109 length:963 start_codon:yes stop_codon:yes gene_type:complete